MAVDADRVQDYVYESARLPEVRGASALLDWLCARLGDLLKDPTINFTDGLNTLLDPTENVALSAASSVPPPVAERTEPILRRLRAVTEQLGFGGIEVVYAAGGSLLAIVPADQAEEIGECLTGLYKAVTLVATATYAVIPYEAQRFQHCYRVLGRELRRRKDDKPNTPLADFLPDAGQPRCSSCDLRASIGEYTHSYSDGTSEPRPICAACRIKIAARDLPKMGWKLQETAQRSECPSTGAFAQDLDEIGRRCRPAGQSGGRDYIAAIYMDGDGMGARVEEQATSAADLREFSTRLSGAMEKAVLETVVAALPPVPSGREYKKWPFQIPYIGGDDLFLLVPADVALDVAKKIRDAFSATMAGMTLSAGVVMCDTHYPVYFLHRMAKALCASAKRRGGDRVDFQILRSGSVTSTDPRQLRRQITSVAGVGGRRVERRSLTMRPYTWDDLDVLLKTYRKLREPDVDYPKGQLIALASEALKSCPETSSLYLYQLARAKTRQVHALKQIAEALGSISPPPWRLDDSRSQHERQIRDYTTILGDLVDMYGVVQEEAPLWPNTR